MPFVVVDESGVSKRSGFAQWVRWWCCDSLPCTLLLWVFLYSFLWMIWVRSYFILECSVYLHISYWWVGGLCSYSKFLVSPTLYTAVLFFKTVLSWNWWPILGKFFQVGRNHRIVYTFFCCCSLNLSLLHCLGSKIFWITDYISELSALVCCGSFWPGQGALLKMKGYKTSYVNQFSIHWFYKSAAGFMDTEI